MMNGVLIVAGHLFTLVQHPGVFVKLSVLGRPPTVCGRGW